MIEGIFGADCQGAIDGTQCLLQVTPTVMGNGFAHQANVPVGFFLGAAQAPFWGSFKGRKFPANSGKPIVRFGGGICTAAM